MQKEMTKEDEVLEGFESKKVEEDIIEVKSSTDKLDKDRISHLGELFPWRFLKYKELNYFYAFHHLIAQSSYPNGEAIENVAKDQCANLLQWSEALDMLPKSQQSLLWSLCLALPFFEMIEGLGFRDHIKLWSMNPRKYAVHIANLFGAVLFSDMRGHLAGCLDLPKREAPPLPNFTRNRGLSFPKRKPHKSSKSQQDIEPEPTYMVKNFKLDKKAQKLGVSFKIPSPESISSSSGTEAEFLNTDQLPQGKQDSPLSPGEYSVPFKEPLDTIVLQTNKVSKNGKKRRNSKE